MNPKNGALAQRLKDAGLPVLDIHELKAKAEAITGAPKALPKGDRVVADPRCAWWGWRSGGRRSPGAGDRCAGTPPPGGQSTGAPKALPKGDRVVAEVISRDGETLDRICAVPEL